MAGSHAKTVEFRKEIGAFHQTKNPAPITVLDEVPKPPSYLKQEGRELWKHTCQALIEMRCLTLQSLTAIECHVNAILVMRDTMKDAKVKLSTKAGVIDQARKSASELGLSQQAHAKVRVPK